MKNKFLILLLVAGLASLVAGCVSTVDGRSEAGIPFLKDSVEGRYERTVPVVFAAAKQVLAFNGALVAENTLNNSLEARIAQREVFVRVQELDPVKPITRLVVQTRTPAGGTDIDLAHEIEKQIALKMAAH
ncbi:hypothetical protein [Pedosphaera parvula]|uniref:DUF3568 family protein n=1 Tax=Pedosphaera parvula (strain Ellin514) TaxID=320771 RepID=B9XSI8_PEDPL|nr:hypothetical protein [Pedosphaera parvula]EEF57188.1 hypothetical protein Cflav_PD0195 [Pedosphaera parvula Ellin514]